MNQMLDTTSMMMIPEFTLPSDWVDQCSELMIMNDEEFSAASTEVSMIYEQFQMEEDEPAAAAAAAQLEDPSLMMDVEDEPLLCSNLLLLDDDEIFHDPCLPPSGGLEYLESISMDDRFSLSLLEEEPVDEELSSADDDDDDSATSTSQPQRGHEDQTAVAGTPANNRNNNDPLFEERYKVMLDRLAESMRRSQETRKSLTIHTAKTKDYDRRKSLSGVLSSVEKSTSAIQALLHTRLS